ncbi:MAG: sigma-70 family RNA polymerase sigma factor [Planctomycetota bacterium]|nr:sigma-70 family RNA polymerase sigma factor [Planctomycetota bacterium]
MGHDETEQQLVAAASRGDAAAWARLVDRYRTLVYSVPRSYRMPSDACDDIFQTVFFLLFRNLDSLRDSGGLARWLITTCERECWRLMRKGASERQRAEARAAEQPVEADDDRVRTWETRQRVLVALDALEERCRTLLTMLFREPGTANYDTVAQTLQIPRGSIGPQRARCLQKLLELAGDLNDAS